MPKILKKEKQIFQEIKHKIKTKYILIKFKVFYIYQFIYNISIFYAYFFSLCSSKFLKFLTELISSSILLVLMEFKELISSLFSSSVNASKLFWELMLLLGWTESRFCLDVNEMNSSISGILVISKVVFVVLVWGWDEFGFCDGVEE